MELRLTFPLRELLQQAIAGDCSREQLSELHRLSYIIGLRYVRMRCVGGRLPLSLFGMSESDIVHDCIADLFTRSPSGELIEISRYFRYRRVDPSSLPEDMLIVHMRNLVFTVVCDNLFRMLNEADPTLGKIIRNIKLAVRKSDRWSIETRFDEKVLVLRCDGRAPCGGEDAMSARALMPAEQFTPVVNALLGRHREIPSILEALALELNRPEPPGGLIPVIGLAVALKVGFEGFYGDTGAGYDENGEETAEPEENLRVMISECCRLVEAEMRPKYVGKRKVDEVTFCRYIAALEMLFLGDCGMPPDDGKYADATYFDALREVVPSLTRSEYAEIHRPVFEYLARLIKVCLREKLDRR